jgi:hypothetical protein
MSVTAYSILCQSTALSNTPVQTYDSSEPLPWDNMIVSSQNASGLPLIVDYYLGDILQFVHTWTYDASDNVTSLTIS